MGQALFWRCRSSAPLLTPSALRTASTGRWVGIVEGGSRGFRVVFQPILQKIVGKWIWSADRSFSFIKAGQLKSAQPPCLMWKSDLTILFSFEEREKHTCCGEKAGCLGQISGASFRDGLLLYTLEKSQKSNFEMSSSQVPGEEESHEAQLTTVRTEECEKLNS